MFDCGGGAESESESEVETAASNPFAGATLYVDPDSNAAEQIAEWESSRPEDALLLQRIASQPAAFWFGDWNDDIFADVDERVTEVTDAGDLPVLVAYNIPNRDCGGYSAGGSEDAQAYLEWIQDFASAIGERDAVVVLEPDAAAAVSCLSDEDQVTRLSLLSQATTVFKAQNGVAVYIDAGHSNWVEADEMAERLDDAGIAQADGFALNVSNFYTTEEITVYGTELSVLVGDKHFIIDTSRNGLGSNGEWCNPEGRALGDPPTVDTGNELIDALLWIKPPGQSDGTCNDGPDAGEWWAEYALELAR